jgi:hypothetical protein
MIGIGKPCQFGRDAPAPAHSGDFVGFSGFLRAQKPKNVRAAMRSMLASRRLGR